VKARNVRVLLRMLVLAPPLAALVACNAPRADSSSLPAPSGSAMGPTPTIDVVRVVSKPLDTTTQLEGELEPYERVAIFARANGFVSQVLVDRGSHVKQGQLLVTVVAPELGAQRAEAQAKLQGDKSTFERLKAASQTPGAVAGHELEVAEAATQADQARLDSLRAMEQYLSITAPFEGTVIELGVHPGALVGPQAGAGAAATPLLRIEQLHKLRLIVAVPESLVGGIAEGVTASFSVRSFPGMKFSGVTKRVAGSIDTKTRSMPVELDVDNADGRLAPGMFATVVWPVKRTAASNFVPPSSIVQSPERTFVARVKDGTIEQVPVQRGISQGDLVEVFGALSADDVIAKRGSEDLRNGTHVEGRAAPPKPAH
jgi:membrane fusion protein (multidrug efflux system)